MDHCACRLISSFDFRSLFLDDSAIDSRLCQRASFISGDFIIVRAIEDRFLLCDSSIFFAFFFCDSTFGCLVCRIGVVFSLNEMLIDIKSFFNDFLCDSITGSSFRSERELCSLISKLIIELLDELLIGITIARSDILFLDGIRSDDQRLLQREVDCKIEVSFLDGFDSIVFKTECFIVCGIEGKAIKAELFAIHINIELLTITDRSIFECEGEIIL